MAPWVSGFMIFLILLFPSSLYADDFTSDSFKVKDPVIQGGGGSGSSTNFQLTGTIPYISPVYGSSTSFNLRPGFLAYPEEIIPSLSFSISTTSINLALTPVNTFTGRATTTLTVSTNASNGYRVLMHSDGPLRKGLAGLAIADWTGTHASPTVWPGTCDGDSECGFGYSTNDEDLTQFSGSKFAAFINSSPGNSVSQSDDFVTEETDVNFKVSVPSTQAGGGYRAIIFFVAVPNF